MFYLPEKNNLINPAFAIEEMYLGRYAASAANTSGQMTS